MGLPQQLAADWSRILQDWGEPVRYQVVAAELNLETREIEEQVTETLLLGLIGSQAERLQRGLAGQALRGERQVVVRTVDLPEDAPQLTDRILIGDEEFTIIGFHQEDRGAMTRIVLSRR